MDHRPEKLSDLNLQAEAAVVRETEDLYRLYRREWVIVHTVSGEGDPQHHVPAEPFVTQARTWVEDTYAGRVESRDVQLVAHTDGANAFWVHVKVRKPNLKGEFKQAFLAQRHADKQGWHEVEIVGRNSRRDHELRNHGIKKTA